MDVNEEMAIEEYQSAWLGNQHMVGVWLWLVGVQAPYNTADICRLFLHGVREMGMDT